MSKLKLKKAHFLTELNCCLLDLFSDEDKVKEEACAYRISQVLSDTPPEATSDDYPYEVMSKGVRLNTIFAPLFNKGELPFMSKREADDLCAKDIGYEKKYGLPVRIYRDSSGITIRAFTPSGEVFVLDCFAGDLELEK